jgi:hypothetical protein
MPSMKCNRSRDERPSERTRLKVNYGPLTSAKTLAAPLWRPRGGNEAAVTLCSYAVANGVEAHRRERR